MKARRQGRAVALTNPTSTGLRLCRRWTPDQKDPEKAPLAQTRAEAATTEVHRPQARRSPPAHLSVPEPP
jgi:hypothetical protein